MFPVRFPAALSDKEAAELKAHHLACTQLVSGCQAAIFRLRGETGRNAGEDTLSHRAVEIMESIVDSWCETLSILRSAMKQGSSRASIAGIDFGTYGEIAAQESARKIAQFSKSMPAAAGERERAGS